MTSEVSNLGEENPTDLNLAFPISSELCTKPLFLFLQRYHQIFKFLFFSSNLAVVRDQTRLIAARALATRSEEDKKYLEELERNKNPTFEKFRDFADFQSENMCIRLADNFLCYISDVTQICMKSRPEVLRSSETVKVEDILKLSSYTEVVEFLVERKINELSYAGTNKLNDFFTQRFGYSLWTSNHERSILIVAIEIRNIHTHSRGIVNRIFLNRIKDTVHPFNFTNGRKFHAGFDDLVILAKNMALIARRVDALAAEKFDILKAEYSKCGSALGEEQVHEKIS